MPTCPNCGEILMRGDPYCSHCGTIIRWYDEDDDEDDFYHDFDISEFVDSEILIDLYNQGFSFNEVLNMQNDVNEFSNDFSCKLVEAQIHEGLILFLFFKEEKYWSVILRAGYDPNNPVKKFNFHEDIFEGNFEKLYSDEKFRKGIRQK